MSRTTTYIFHHENYLVLCLDSFVELCDMRMVKALHELDLTSHGFLPLNLFHLFLLVYLKSYLFPSSLVHSNMDCSVSSLSNLLTNDIIVDSMLIRKNYDFLCRHCLGRNFAL
jgi:hypothetical protein